MKYPEHGDRDLDEIFILVKLIRSSWCSGFARPSRMGFAKLKAGSTGSTPGGGATPKNATSAALQHLLDEIGKSSFYLNTIVVGLDAVEKGHAKPASLDVKWEPTDRKAAARMARLSAIEAFLIRAAEAIQAYVKALSVLPRFGDIKDNWDHETAGAEKLSSIAESLLKKDDYRIAGAMLLIAWRNLIVHNGKFTFAAHRESLLKKNRQAISEEYRNLDITELLRHVRENRPTLKDASSLIAMTINLARAIDHEIYSKLNKEDVSAWLRLYSLDNAIRKI